MRLLFLLILCTLGIPASAANLMVDLRGIEGEQLTNVHAFLDIYQASKDPKYLTVPRIKHLHKIAPSQIKQALKPFGYYQVTVIKHLISTEEKWSVQYQVDKGEAVRIKKLDFVLSGYGRKDKTFLDAKSRFPLAEGTILNHVVYDKLKQELQRIALAKGYLSAQFNASEVRVDLEKNSANITVHFDTGPQFLFGDVKFVQLGEQLDEAFLRRYIPFKSGSPYSTEALVKLQKVLSDSDHFSRIEIDQLFNEIQGLTVPLKIRVTPRKPKKYRFGLGYGTDSGARASAEHQRRVSPKGHTLTLKTKISERINRVDMQYMMPLKNPASDQFTMTTHFFQQVTESRKTNAGALDFRHITNWKNWRQAIGLTFEREDYKIADESGSSQLVMPNIELLRSVFNFRIYPTRGNRLSAEAWLSHTTWLSDTDFLQVRLSGKWIFPITQNGRFLFRLSTGGTAIGIVDELPASKRFYAGGDQSIRGYAYEELGPLNNQGENIGGKYLAVGSAEYEYRFLGTWGVAVFYDVGNSFNTFSEKVYRGYGAGIRWRSMVGPIRFDFGWPEDKTVEYPRFHLVIGLDL